MVLVLLTLSFFHLVVPLGSEMSPPWAANAVSECWRRLADSNTLSDFCREPKPGGRGGKMLEETPKLYSFYPQNVYGTVHG